MSAITHAAPPPPDALEAETDSAALANGTRVVAAWSVAGRITGFGRVVVLAAVLGPTFFGNLFQTALFVPWVLCELMAGSVIPSLLAPRLVHLLDQGRTGEVSRMARGFLGILLPVFALASVVVAAFVPVLVWIITVAVPDPAVRSREMLVGVPLLLALLPQIICYAVIGTGVAVQHAHRRFAFATAAPMIENIGMIVVLLVWASVFGVGSDVQDITITQTVTLGLGATMVVALHAAAQWWGARRLGFTLFPEAGWRHADVREVVRLAVPSSAAAGLNSSGMLAMLVASGHVPGGAVAFQIAYSFYNLPIAFGARPISIAQLPILARDFGRSAEATFQANYRRGLRMALFVAIPTGLLFLGIPNVLAGAVTVGRMDSDTAIGLITAALWGLSFGIAAEAVLVVSTSAAYARLNASAQLKAAFIRVLVYVVAIPLIFFLVPAQNILAVLAVTYSAAVTIAALSLGRTITQSAPLLTKRSWLWLLQNGLAAAAAMIPSAFIARYLDLSGADFTARVLGTGGLLLLSAAIYLLIQWTRGSPELKVLLASLTPRRRGRPIVSHERGAR